jgi:hypothetical protein
MTLDKCREPKQPIFFWGLGISMPLTRGVVVGYDSTRMAYKFTMMDGNRIIDCQISSVAMDYIAGRRWQKISIDRDAQFLECRDTIERIASTRFDAKLENPVRIFAKHFYLYKKVKGMAAFWLGL